MPSPSSLTRRLAAAVALVGWGALILQFYLSLRLAVANGQGIAGGIFIYFGYFTILTNILAALALSTPLLMPDSTLGRFFARPDVNTAVAAAMALVGLAYSLLLRRLWTPTGLQLLADVALHDVMPVLFLIYWWAAIPRTGVLWTDLPTLGVYPLGYLLYMLVRGLLAKHYPYHFLDPSVLGYGRVFVNAFLLLVGFLTIAALLVGASQLRRGVNAPAERA